MLQNDAKPIPQSTMSSSQSDAQVDELCRLAFEAEHYSTFQEAFDKHTEALAALLRLADDSKYPDKERKAIARRQIHVHSLRKRILQEIMHGRRTDLDAFLPTSRTLQNSLAALVNGRPCLSQDEMLLAETLKPLYDQVQAAVLVDNGKAVGRKKAASAKQWVNSNEVLATFIASTKDNVSFISPRIQHIFTTNEDSTRSVSYYSPRLDKTQPDVQFHLSVSRELLFKFVLIRRGIWYNFEVKDSKDGPTLYVLRGFRPHGYQITTTQLSRVTELASPCVRTLIEQVKPDAHFQKGRQLTHFTSSPWPVVDKPEHGEWEPRRFTWGGRQFVWRLGRSEVEVELCEVKQEWPEPADVAGKIRRECFEPLLHAPKYMLSTQDSGVITFRFGCATDVLFRELVLASFLTCQLISGFPFI